MISRHLWRMPKVQRSILNNVVKGHQVSQMRDQSLFLICCTHTTNMGQPVMEYAEEKTASDMHALGIPDTEFQVIQQLISDLCDDPSIEAIYLYGSYARSEQKPYSDIDIAVMTGSSSPSRTKKELIGSYSSKKCDIQVFSDLPLPAQMQVLSQGVPLMVKHPEYMRRLIRSVSLTYMDHEPMRNRLKRRILRADNGFN